MKRPHRIACVECQKEIQPCGTWTEYILPMVFVLVTGLIGCFLILMYYSYFRLGVGGFVNQEINRAMEYDTHIAKHAIINTFALVILQTIGLLSMRAYCFCYNGWTIFFHAVFTVLTIALAFVSYQFAAKGVQLQPDRPKRTSEGNLKHVRPHAGLGLTVLCLYPLQCVTGLVLVFWRKDMVSKIHRATGVGIHVITIMTAVSAFATEQKRHSRSETLYVAWSREHLMHGPGAIFCIAAMVTTTLIILRKELSANHAMVVADKDY